MTPKRLRLALAVAAACAIALPPSSSVGGDTSFDPLLDDAATCVPGTAGPPGPVPKTGACSSRNGTLPAGARETGTRRHAGAVQEPGHRHAEGRHEQCDGAGVVRPGRATDVRVQPCGGDPRVPRSPEARSALRPVLLGRVAGVRTQHQRADDAGGERPGARRAGEGGRTCIVRTAARPCPHRRPGEALFGGPEGRARQRSMLRMPRR